MNTQDVIVIMGTLFLGQILTVFWGFMIWNVYKKEKSKMNKSPLSNYDRSRIGSIWEEGDTYPAITNMVTNFTDHEAFEMIAAIDTIKGISFGCDVCQEEGAYYEKDGSRITDPERIAEVEERAWKKAGLE